MEVKSYEAPLWRNHNQEPCSGRPLMLLNHPELKIAQTLLLRKISANFLILNPEYLTSSANINLDLKQKLVVSIKRSIKILVDIEEELLPHHLMDNFNEDLNTLFTDMAWRSIRLEISQIKKRNKKKRIELSIDIIEKLNNIKALNGLPSYDDVIEYLVEAEAENKENGVNHG